MKNSKLLAIISALILVGVGLWFMYSLTRPTQEEIDAIKEKVLIVPSDILSGSVFNQLDNFKQNGTLPISIGAQEKGLVNPFASF